MKVPADTVLCPTDLSTTGNLAVAVAFRLAADGGRVHLLHVVEPPYLGNPVYGPFVQGYIPTPEDTKEGEAKVLAALRALVPPAGDGRGVQEELHVVHGVDVPRVIEEEARRLGAEVVVMGTHGRSGLGRLLLGSVAEKVVKAKDLPAVLVNPDVAD